MQKLREKTLTEHAAYFWDVRDGTMGASLGFGCVCLYALVHVAHLSCLFALRCQTMVVSWKLREKDVGELAAKKWDVGNGTRVGSLMWIWCALIVRRCAPSLLIPSLLFLPS